MIFALGLIGEVRYKTSLMKDYTVLMKTAYAFEHSKHEAGPVHSLLCA